MLRSLFALAVALLATFNLSAQKNKRPDYKLLWRISGNGLSKPSYLFGTMHVQDKRAFNLNDSVIAKIIQCEAFALEFHPDSVTQFMASIVLDGDRNRTIESQMTSKDFAYYDSLMKKKDGLSLRNFKTAKQVRYFLEQRSFKKDKSTFLDAWLYNIAREHGKVMTGVENFSVQQKIFERDDSTELESLKKYLKSSADYREGMESIFDLYFGGDVEAIYDYSKRNSSTEEFKEMIVDRNANMTDNIIREVHKQTIFVAVGAAHLGGDIGIVNLLRQKGYTVTPVNAAFSGTASSYKNKSVVAPNWFTYSDADGGYSVEMPQRPFPFQTADMPITFQAYIDIGTLTAYLTASMPIGRKVEAKNLSKALDDMSERMSGTKKLLSAKKVMMDGHEARELDLSFEGNLFKVKFTIYESFAYMLMVGPSKETAGSAEAKRFLSSFKLTPPTTKSSSNAERFENMEGAFSVDMYGNVTTQEITPTDPSSGKPLKIKLFISTDRSTGISYFVRYNDFPVGFISVNDSVYIQQTLLAISNKVGGATPSVDKINFNGYPASHFKFLTPDQTIRVEGILTLRGERFYLLMTTCATEGLNKGAIQSFFNSFKFTPFEKPALKEVSFPEDFSLKVPETFESDSSFAREYDGSNLYSFIDRHSGIMYVVRAESFSEYDQAENQKSYFSTLKESFRKSSQGFDITAKDSAIDASIPMHEFLLQTPSDNSVTRIRTGISGKSSISLWGYMPAHDDDLSVSDEIFNSLKIKRSTSEWNLFADKTEQILKEISATDSTTRAQARTALSSHEFRKTHLPLVYDALKRTYSDDAEEWSSTKGKLLNILRTIQDENTQGFIEKMYGTLPDSSYLKDDALAVLSSLKTKESLKSVVDIISADKGEGDYNSYTILNPMQDSLLLLNDIGLDLLNLLPKFSAKGKIFDVTKEALDSNAYTLEKKSQIIAKVNELAVQMANIPADTASDDYYSQIGEKFSLVELLSAIPFTSQIENYVRKIALENDEDLKLLCTKLLLKNNATVSPKDLNYLASQPSVRLLLYEELVKYKKQDRIDKKYSTQKMLAESEVREYLSYDDEYPEMVEFFKEKNIIRNGEKMKILVFKYSYAGGEGASYAVMAGPYALKAKEFKRGDLTTSFYPEYTTEKELNEKLAKYLAVNNAKLAD